MLYQQSFISKKTISLLKWYCTNLLHTEKHHPTPHQDFQLQNLPKAKNPFCQKPFCHSKQKLSKISFTNVTLIAVQYMWHLKNCQMYCSECHYVVQVFNNKSNKLPFAATTVRLMHRCQINQPDAEQHLMSLMRLFCFSK